MQNDKQVFIKLCIEHNILKFGEFELKSGRISPYFFNAGLFNNGHLLAQLASFYAALIAREITASYMLYGPAYKGIPLAAATAVHLSLEQSQSVNYAFNRKEAKDHGEGGMIVGAELEGNVVIIDDVITAGTSTRESVDIITAAKAKPFAVVIAVDRQETAGDEALSAVQSVEKKFGIPVHAIITLDDLISHLEQDHENQQHFDRILQYREKYGAR